MSHGSIDQHIFSGVKVSADDQDSWEIKIHEKGEILVAEILDGGS